MTPANSSPHLLEAPKLLEGGMGYVSAPSEGIITRSASIRSSMTSSTSSGNPYRPIGVSDVEAIPRRPVPPSLPRRPVPPPRPASMSMVPPGMGLGLEFVPSSAASISEDESADAALVSDGMHHRQQRDHSQRMPMLPEEDQLADIALVSDGMRPTEPMLPPYEPRRGGQMAGHGSEDNEMRLSEYVKGQTRAQGMKDSGGY